VGRFVPAILKIRRGVKQKFGNTVCRAAWAASCLLFLKSEEGELNIRQHCLQGGVGRFSHTLLSGLAISLDYKITLRGLDDRSEEYQEAISKVGFSYQHKVLAQI
jgi:hypothetical protein